MPPLRLSGPALKNSLFQPRGDGDAMGDNKHGLSDDLKLGFVIYSIEGYCMFPIPRNDPHGRA